VVTRLDVQDDRQAHRFASHERVAVEPKRGLEEVRFRTGGRNRPRKQEHNAESRNVPHRLLLFRRRFLIIGGAGPRGNPLSAL